ncbi:HAD family hydrolase [Microlunatus sp. Y2014]|uniref:HAD family hydrolase n=1 Tax=Microlunatus sp. Y2014 TaxID=3418488 RepID=UPI003DA782D5
MTITTVLWDADGVLQDAAPGWYDRLVAMGGPEFPQACMVAERGPLTGDGSFADAIGELVARFGLAVPTATVLDIWTQITLDPEAIDLVSRVRAAGTRCVLATNQQEHRLAAMSALGYPELMDALYPSCHLGVAKPDPAYFHAILTAEGIEATDALFIDDRDENVAAARHVGLAAVRHDPESGVVGLQQILQSYGVSSDVSTSSTGGTGVSTSSTGGTNISTGGTGVSTSSTGGTGVSTSSTGGTGVAMGGLAR